MELLIATGNPGKVREYEELLAGLPITCTSPADVGVISRWMKAGPPMQRMPLKARPLPVPAGA